MKKIFFFFIIIFLLSILFIPFGESEKLTDFYSNKKTFNYMDICNYYTIFNQSDNMQLSDRIINTDCVQIESFEYTTIDGGEDRLKPSKMLKLSNFEQYENLLLFTKYVYNWSTNIQLKFDIFYEDLDNITYNLPIIYNSYKSKALTDNMTNDYYTIDGGLQYYSTINQSVMQRFSNIYNSNENTNPFSSYQKEYGVSNTLTQFNTQNISYRDYDNIRTNQWVTVTIKDVSFLYDQSVYNALDFLNIIIERQHLNHTMLIKNLQVLKNNVDDDLFNMPFTELYEFKEINNNWSERRLFQVDLINNNYQTLSARPLWLNMNSNGELEFYYNHVEYWESSEMKVDNETNINYFCGYQFYLSKDENNNYHAYIYYKFSYNSRDSDKELHYNYSFIHITIESEEYAYLCNYQYYDDSNNTDIQIGYLSNFMKWDIIDNEIRKIDFDQSNEVILIHDVDSGGLRIPSISDLRKMITKALSPLTTTITNLKDELLKPINNLLNKVDSGLSSLSVIVNSITSLISDMNSQFSSISSLITNEFSSITATVQNGFTNILNQLSAILVRVETISNLVSTIWGELQDILASIDVILSEVQGFPSIIQDVIDNIDNIIVIIIDFFSALSDIILYLSTLVSAIPSSLALFFNFIIDFFGNFMSFFINIFLVSLSLIALVLIYGIIIPLYKYNQTGELEDLYGVATAFMNIGNFIFSIVKVIFNFIAGIIP